MTEPFDRVQLEAAMEDADLRVLLMVLFHLSGEERWLQPPYTPARDVRLIAEEDAGLAPEVQVEIRAAVVELLLEPERQALVDAPDEALLLHMMGVCLAEEVAPEYAPMMLEQMGFRPLLQDLPPLERAVPPDALPVVIAGAGVSGICLGKLLLDVGVPFTIIEKNSQVGGTWWENTYPGCGVDTPNHAYSFSFGPRYRWRSFFSPREDIQDYLEKTAAEAGLRPYIRFESSIESATWNERQQCWQVSVACADGMQTIRAAALVSAVGQLNLPSLPEISGAERFNGPLFHSSRWPEELDITGKRVAVIGTGASAMQIVPGIAGQVSQLTIFQRSPQWARPIPRYHDALTEGAQWLLANVPYYAAWMRFTMFWRYGDGLLPFLRRDPEWIHPERSMNRVNEKHRLEMLAHIEQVVGDRQDLLEKCVPDYPPYGKRILLDNGWFETLLRDNVTLETAPITRLEEDAVVTDDGQRTPVDVVVLATGFQVGKMAARLNITGRGGQRLADLWAPDNPTAHLGITVAGFPNLFCMLGPNTGLGHGGSAIFQAECQARYIAQSLVYLRNNSAASMEVDAAVQAEFVERADREHSQMIWSHPRLSTYYRNSLGRVFSLLPWRLVDYWQMTRHLNPDDFHFSPDTEGPEGDGEREGSA